MQHLDAPQTTADCGGLKGLWRACLLALGLLPLVSGVSTVSTSACLGLGMIVGADSLEGDGQG